MKTLHNSLTFELSDIAKYRLHVLDNFYEHGIKSTMDAFSLKRSVIYLWKKKYEESKKNLDSLIPQSTKPKRTRDMVVNPLLSSFIKSFRETYGNISKYKIKIFLDEFAKDKGIDSFGISKIGKLIKRRGWFFEGREIIKKKHKLNSILRLKKAPKVKEAGYIEMDSITVYVNCKKYYFCSIIDVYSRYAFVKLVPSLSSKNTIVVFLEFKEKYPKKILTVQTDNGSEFLGEFHKLLLVKGIKHELTYFRSPKINGTVERFNRTIQEEFINRSEEIFFDLKKFEEKMINYLNWYNFKRPHYSLNFQTPYSYLTKNNN